eukprot:5559078-Amphidinium_carterae.1
MNSLTKCKNDEFPAGIIQCQTCGSEATSDLEKHTNNSVASGYHSITIAVGREMNVTEYGA